MSLRGDGMIPLERVLGNRYGKLIVTAIDSAAKMAVCLCDCGNTHAVGPWHLLQGHTRSCGCLRKRGPKNTTLEHILAHCKVGGPDDCWEWQRARNPAGYGCITFRGRQMTASRAVLISTKGELPSKVLACHTCDNPPCCNPGHLFAGTHLDNVHDMERKGRRVVGIGKNLRKEYCKRNLHLLEGNEFWNSNGSRTCKICRAEKLRARFLRNREKINAYRRARYARLRLTTNTSEQQT